MLSHKSLLYALLLLLVSTSCQRFVDIDLTGQSQMVVSCFLSPDQADIIVSVSQNQIVGSFGGLDPEDFVVADAVVALENISQGRVLNLAFEASENHYTIPNTADFLRARDSFQLKIEHPSLPTVSGRCQIPAAPQGFRVQLDSVLDDSPFPDFYCQTSWTDFEGEPNYYRLIGKIIPDTTFIVKEAWFFRWQGLSTNPDYVTDINFEGETIIGPSGDLQNVARELNGVRPPRMPGDSLTVSLLHLDQNYYRYMQDLRQNRNLDLAFSEPYTIYSNLEGGIGIFAAYHAVEERLRIR